MRHRSGGAAFPQAATLRAAGSVSCPKPALTTPAAPGVPRPQGLPSPYATLSAGLIGGSKAASSEVARWCAEMCRWVDAPAGSGAYSPPVEWTSGAGEHGVPLPRRVEGDAKDRSTVVNDGRSNAAHRWGGVGGPPGQHGAMYGPSTRDVLRHLTKRPHVRHGGGRLHRRI